MSILQEKPPEDRMKMEQHPPVGLQEASLFSRAWSRGTGKTLPTIRCGRRLRRPSCCHPVWRQSNFLSMSYRLFGRQKEGGGGTGLNRKRKRKRRCSHCQWRQFWRVAWPSDRCDVGNCKIKATEVVAPRQ